MSKADELFKELGYRKDYEHDYRTGYIYGDKILTFHNENKCFEVIGFHGGTEEITFEELKAINEKVKELGWEE